MSESRVPSSCNHCNHTVINFNKWGRTEYYTCDKCKKEVTYVEPPQLNPWGFPQPDPNSIWRRNGSSIDIAYNPSTIAGPAGILPSPTQSSSNTTKRGLLDLDTGTINRATDYDDLIKKSHDEIWELIRKTYGGF